jgi:exopolysaccharide biosynthesis polyprenyl glycosylphosphotransferase
MQVEQAGISTRQPTFKAGMTRAVNFNLERDLIPVISKPGRQNLMKALLFLSDLLGIGIAYFVVATLREPGHSLLPLPPIMMGLAIVINLVCLYLLVLYRIDEYSPFWRTPLMALTSAALAGVILILFSYLEGARTHPELLGRTILIGAQSAFGIWSGINRLALAKWMRSLNRRVRWLVVGTDEYIPGFYRDLRQNRVTGAFCYLSPEGTEIPLPTSNEDGHPLPVAAPHFSFHRIGSWDDLEKMKPHEWTGALVCSGPRIHESLIETIMRLRLAGMRIYDLTDFYELVWYKLPVFYLNPSWFALTQGFSLLHDPVGFRLKRIGDALCAILLLLLVSPVLAVVGILIKLESPGPIIFRQTRVGENGKHFTVLKLRSMRQDAEKDGAQWATLKDTRVTRLGTFIRATRLDETIQLWNVLMGDMSFIGPRPERPEFTGMLENEIPFYNLRHLVRPGVTGWAQVMYPYGASVEDARQKLQYDLYYIKNYSLILDLAITLKTVRVVLFGKGR